MLPLIVCHPRNIETQSIDYRWISEANPRGAGTCDPPTHSHIKISSFSCNFRSNLSNNRLTSPSLYLGNHGSTAGCTLAFEIDIDLQMKWYWPSDNLDLWPHKVKLYELQYSFDLDVDPMALILHFDLHIVDLCVCVYSRWCSLLHQFKSYNLNRQTYR